MCEDSNTNKMNEYIKELKKAKKEGIEPEEFASQSALDGDGMSVLENLWAYAYVGANIQEVAEQVALNDELTVLESLDICEQYGVDMKSLMSTLVHSDTRTVIGCIDMVLASHVHIDDLVRLIGENGDASELRCNYGEFIERGATPALLDLYTD